MAQFSPAWAAQLGPAIDRSLEQAAKARAEREAQEAAQSQGVASALGYGLGSIAAGAAGLPPQAGGAVGNIIGQQAYRIAEGKGPGFDNTAQGIGAATGALAAGSALNSGYDKQQGAAAYNDFLAGLIEPGSEDRLTAYLAMPAGLANRLEGGDLRLFDAWYNSGVWQI